MGSRAAHASVWLSPSSPWAQGEGGRDSDGVSWGSSRMRGMGLARCAEGRDSMGGASGPSHAVPSAPTGLPAIFVAVWVSVRATLANTG